MTPASSLACASGTNFAFDKPVGALIAAAPAGGSFMDLNELARKLQLLEDLEAIKTLKYQYCAFCDDHYNAVGIAGLFVEDGIWDGGDFGYCVGPAAIHKFFLAAPKGLSFAAHQVMNPISVLDGDHATGAWKPPAMHHRDPQRSRAMWPAANYQRYLRQHSHRLGSSKVLKVTSLFFTPHDDGWVKTALPLSPERF